jgi:tellurite resistance protein TehA-like permease
VVSEKRLPSLMIFPVPVPVCAITASGVPGGAFVSMKRFSTLCG